MVIMPVRWRLSSRSPKYDTGTQMTEIETKALDPVCGMTVDPNRAAGSYEYQGKTYYFCSTHCLHRFRENPQAFCNQNL